MLRIAEEGGWEVNEHVKHFPEPLKRLIARLLNLGFSLH